MKKWILVLFAPVIAFAQGNQNEAETELPSVVIDGIMRPQGAEVKSFIEPKRLEQSQHLDMNRVLREAPGVYVQEEDSYGLRPNIGLRGVHPHRSKKITFLEDGLLIGPAPYAAPAAYYTPSRSRMESMEVLRGFSAVPFGPNTVGGTVNDITQKIPEDSLSKLMVQGGTAEFFRAHLALARQHGNFSWLLVGDRSESGGFKKLDTGGPTGFVKHDLMWKGRLALSEGQSFEVKLAMADEVSHESYLGLTSDDFASNPYRRYAASEKDKMSWHHQQVDLTYRRPTHTGESSVSLYSRWFWRNWQRLNDFAGAVKVSTVLQDPTQGVNPDYLDVLRGRLDSSAIGGGAANILYANNERAFLSRGILLGHREEISGAGTWNHQADIGLLLHEDQINRRHTEDQLEMQNGRLVDSGIARRDTALNQDRALAKVLRGQWQSKTGSWTLAASARAEEIEYRMRDDLVSSKESMNEHVFVPGVGVAYGFADVWEVFQNLSQGVTLKGPDKNSRQEQSLTWEGGLRRRGDFNVDMTLFQTTYDRLKSVCSFASGCTNSALLDSSFEGGSARVRGFESQFSGSAFVGAWTLSPRLNLTWLDAKFMDRFQSDVNSEWGGGTIEAGDPLPYVPTWQTLFGFEIEKGAFRQDWSFAWQSEMADQAVATNRRTVKAYGVIDVSTHYGWSKDLDLFLRLDNVLENKYVVSYRPMGLRPGKERAAVLGLTARF